MRKEINIDIDKKSRQTQLVGYLRNEIINRLALDPTSKEIIIYPGTIKHIRQRHHYAFKNYFHRLTEIIRTPDYIGIVKTDSHKIALIKKYKDNILVALKIEEKGLIIILSMYIITQSAVEKRIQTGGMYKLNIGQPSNMERKHYKNMKRRK